VGFPTNVFVNCPFDSDYLPLLRPLLFTLIDLGFTPRIALEALDSGSPRINKIISLVEESKYAIHDLSRIQAKKINEYFRLNMPFELGLDVGCWLFKPGKWTGKRCLILEIEKYRYQAAISDLSNSDIAAHGNKPINIVTEVRNWLNNEAHLEAFGANMIWGRFNEFMADNYRELRGQGFSPHNIENLTISELMGHMRTWVTRHPKPRRRKR
jgi:hypothetical protein